MGRRHRAPGSASKKSFWVFITLRQWSPQVKAATACYYCNQSAPAYTWQRTSKRTGEPQRTAKAQQCLLFSYPYSSVSVQPNVLKSCRIVWSLCGLYPSHLPILISWLIIIITNCYVLMTCQSWRNELLFVYIYIYIYIQSCDKNIFVLVRKRRFFLILDTIGILYLAF